MCEIQVDFIKKSVYDSSCLCLETHTVGVSITVQMVYLFTTKEESLFEAKLLYPNQ